MRQETAVTHQLPQPHETSHRRKEARMRILRQALLHPLSPSAASIEDPQRHQRQYHGNGKLWNHGRRCVRIEKKSAKLRANAVTITSHRSVMCNFSFIFFSNNLIHIRLGLHFYNPQPLSRLFYKNPVDFNMFSIFWGEIKRSTRNSALNIVQILHSSLFLILCWLFGYWNDISSLW